MKTESTAHPLPRTLGNWLGLGAGLILLLAAPLGWGASTADLLEQGIYAEETKGDLKAAIGIYQQILDASGGDKTVVAQAQLRLGLCELKQGNKPRAISALEKLTQTFPDKDKLLAVIEQHMPALLDELVLQIEQNYLHEIDRGELMETALHAIIGKLDGRGNFLRTNDLEFIGAKDMAQLNAGLDQKVVGIGAKLKLDSETREVVVETPLPNSPALKGGLLPGDRILEIDSTPVPESAGLEMVVKSLRGPIGTSVRVGVKGTGSDEWRRLELVRDAVLLASVAGDRHKPDGSWEFMLQNQPPVGYVRLTHIGHRSPEEMRSALNDLTNRGMKALILDLRNGPGGLLGEAVAIADLFVEEGRIVTVKSRKEERVYSAKAEGTYGGFPMAVLVNRKTASASEIIAACLQDHSRAVVVGERTFGQGLVKSLIHLKGGLGALKLPVASYYRPDGRNMNRFPDAKESDDWGITPDAGYEVTMTDNELMNYERSRSERDRLKSELKVADFRDLQLAKALEYVLKRLSDG